jgi:hypothetical protein
VAIDMWSLVWGVFRRVNRRRSGPPLPVRILEAHKWTQSSLRSACLDASGRKEKSYPDIKPNQTQLEFTGIMVARAS